MKFIDAVNSGKLFTRKILIDTFGIDCVWYQNGAYGIEARHKPKQPILISKDDVNAEDWVVAVRFKE